MSCDLIKSFHDNIIVYNYPLAFMSILSTRHIPCHPCPIQYWALRHLSYYVLSTNASRSLMSFNMICGIPINCLYGHQVMDNVWSTIKYSTPHLGSIVISDRIVDIHYYYHVSNLWHFRIIFYVIWSKWVNPI